MTDIQEKFLRIIRMGPIKEEALAKLLGVRSGVIVRRDFIRPMRIRGIPIASSAKGIWLATKAEELSDTISFLQNHVRSYATVILGLRVAQSILRGDTIPEQLDIIFQNVQKELPENQQ